jgi:hypothetical protein
MLTGCLSAGGAYSDRDSFGWSWLAKNGGTYRCVSDENLQAFLWETGVPEPVRIFTSPSRTDSK